MFSKVKPYSRKQIIPHLGRIDSIVSLSKVDEYAQTLMAQRILSRDPQEEIVRAFELFDEGGKGKEKQCSPSLLYSVSEKRVCGSQSKLPT